MGLKKERISFKNIICWKFYSISETRKLKKSVKADDTILRRQNYCFIYYWTLRTFLRIFFLRMEILGLHKHEFSRHLDIIKTYLNIDSANIHTTLTAPFSPTECEFHGFAVMILNLLFTASPMVVWELQNLAT